MKTAFGRATCLLWLVTSVALAQHEGHSLPAPTPAPGMDASEDAPPGLFSSDMTAMTGMRPSDPMATMEMPGWHVSDLGIARLLFNRQGGPSGGGELESSNWNMLHAQHDFAGGRLTLMLMNSLEPATFPARGSRELFQTGEAYRGEPLVDRQHPHDFFMNLSATYRRALGEDAGIWVQIAPVGEPALGPVAFMHRASSGDNPTAPLGHHWEDSTHIAFEVVTLGGGWKWLAVDASAFRGKEPDEHRWDIESGRIDSASARLRFFLGGGWSAQVSHGFLKHPEPLEEGDLHRTTASLSFGADGGGPVAASLIWGSNDERSGRSQAWLAEAAWQIMRSLQVYGRAEQVDKDAALLGTKGFAANASQGDGLARIRAFTAGVVRDFELIPSLATGVGADATVYAFPRSLRSAYGSSPVSFHGFLRLRWGTPHGGDHAGHAGMAG